VRILVWNLFHGRSRPPAGRSLLNEFCAALDGWTWDVALLQEVPPWWPPLLGRAAGAEHRHVLTSRNELLPVRRAIASRNPDLLGSWGGGANAILVRGRILEHRTATLTRLPERRAVQGVALPGGVWVVNFHATTEPKSRTRADVARAVRLGREWSAGGPLVVGGDYNLTKPHVPGMRRAASHHVDHVFASGFEGAPAVESLDAGTLSDHVPLLVEL
jgi:endonuclease/exonuclease/phosphatase family metal-dependent hydrolase